MDQKRRPAGSILTGVLLLVVALVILPMGISLLKAYPAKEWAAGIMLLLIDGLLVFAAIKVFGNAYRPRQENAGELLRMKPGTTEARGLFSEGIPPVSNEQLPVVLVNWSPTMEEWKQFVKWETRERKMNNVLAGIGLAIGSTLLIHLLRQSSWAISMLVGGGVALIYSLISYQITAAAIGKPMSGHNEIVISTCSVLINNRLTFFVNTERWASQCQIVEEMDPKVLKIIYHWYNRNGTATDEIHIPIPKGKLGEAVRLADTLNLSFSRKRRE